MRWFSWVWASLFAIGFAFEFLVVILGIQGATLSEHLWFIRDKAETAFGLIIAFLVWLVFHLIWQGRNRR